MSNDMLLVIRALDFAAQHHADQRRKGPTETPYINHLIDTARRLAEATEGRDPVLIAAGLLHDVLEDTAAIHADLVVTFGRAVADLVAEVSDDRSLPWRERKRLEQDTAPAKSPRARMIKLADKTCNVADIGPDTPASWDLERKKRYIAWASRVAAGCTGVNDRLAVAFQHVRASSMDALGMSEAEARALPGW